MEATMNSFDKRMNNLQYAMRAAKDEDMKRIWYLKQLFIEMFDSENPHLMEKP